MSDTEKQVLRALDTYKSAVLAKNAETLMNYYYEPEIAAEVAAWVNYVTPVEGAREAMAKSDPELAADTNIFPDEETLSKVHVFRTLTPAEETKYNGQYLEVIGA